MQVNTGVFHHLISQHYQHAAFYTILYGCNVYDDFDVVLFCQVPGKYSIFAIHLITVVTRMFIIVIAGFMIVFLVAILMTHPNVGETRLMFRKFDKHRSKVQLNVGMFPRYFNFSPN